MQMWHPSIARYNTIFDLRIAEASFDVTYYIFSPSIIFRNGDELLWGRGKNANVAPYLVLYIFDLGIILQAEASFVVFCPTVV